MINTPFQEVLNRASFLCRILRKLYKNVYNIIKKTNIKRGIEMFEGCTEINDYITEIFRMGLKESFSQIIDNSEIDGYYLSIPSRDKSKISKLNQWERLFVNIKTKSKRVYGEL